MNIFAILLCVIWAMATGYFWYSPLLFAKSWMRLAEITDKDMKMTQAQMGRMYGTTAVLNFFAAVLLSTFFVSRGDIGYNFILVFALLVVFTLIPAYITNLFNRKPLKLLFINVGYQFVSFLGFAVILSVFG